MDKKTEIKSEIWEIWNILLMVTECFHYSYYLTEPETLQEKEYLKSSRDFHFIGNVIWRTLIIELSKLFCKSKDRDRFNIFHFIKKLKKDGHFGNFGISDSKITRWEGKIEANKNTIDAIMNLRDKVYAHSDPKKEDYLKVPIPFNQIEKLIQIIESVIKEIYITVLESDIETFIFDRERFNIIKILASEEQRRFEEYKESFNSRK